MTNKPTLKLISDLKELFKNFIYNLDETLTIIIAHRESTLKNCSYNQTITRKNILS